MAQKILYSGTAFEKMIETDWNLGLPERMALTWHHDITIAAGGPGVWVNGAGVRGLGYSLTRRCLVGKPSTGRDPSAWLMDDAQGRWICVRHGYGDRATYHRILAPHAAAEPRDAYGRPLAGEEMIPAVQNRMR